MKNNFFIYYSPHIFLTQLQEFPHILGMSSAPWKAELFAEHIQFTDEIISLVSNKIPNKVCTMYLLGGPFSCAFI